MKSVASECDLASLIPLKTTPYETVLIKRSKVNVITWVYFAPLPVNPVCCLNICEQAMMGVPSIA